MAAFAKETALHCRFHIWSSGEAEGKREKDSNCALEVMLVASPNSRPEPGGTKLSSDIRDIVNRVVSVPVFRGWTHLGYRLGHAPSLQELCLRSQVLNALQLHITLLSVYRISANLDRYSVGEDPTSLRMIRLKCVIDWTPTSSAI